jgi:hypothetical protein
LEHLALRSAIPTEEQAKLAACYLQAVLSPAQVQQREEDMSEEEHCCISFSVGDPCHCKCLAKTDALQSHLQSANLLLEQGAKKIDELTEKLRVANARLEMFEARHPGQACPHIHSLRRAENNLEAAEASLSALTAENKALTEKVRVASARLEMFEARHPGQACPHIHSLRMAESQRDQARAELAALKQSDVWQLNIEMAKKADEKIARLEAEIKKWEAHNTDMDCQAVVSLRMENDRKDASIAKYLFGLENANRIIARLSSELEAAKAKIATLEGE